MGFIVMKKIVLIFLALLAMNPIFASKEGILTLSVFHLESDGIGASGKIVIDGQQNVNNQISQLSIHAFDKTYTVSPENLNHLANMTVNGIQISYEQGYQKLGGRTVYIQFQKGFTSGIIKKMILVVTENGQISVLE